MKDGWKMSVKGRRNPKGKGSQKERWGDDRVVLSSSNFGWVRFHLRTFRIRVVQHAFHFCSASSTVSTNAASWVHGAWRCNVDQFKKNISWLKKWNDNWVITSFCPTSCYSWLYHNIYKHVFLTCAGLKFPILLNDAWTWWRREAFSKKDDDIVHVDRSLGIDCHRWGEDLRYATANGALSSQYSYFT